MKKTLLIVAGAIMVSFAVMTISSCSKKTYTCKCSGGMEATIQAISKSAASKACKDLGSDCSIQ
jgi:hypothetical protein